MTNYVRVKLALPNDIVEAFANYELTNDRRSRSQLMLALWQKKWTLESIAQAAGGLSRERVRQIIAATKEDESVVFSVELPTPPIREEKPKKVYAEPNPDTLRRLLELQPFAQRVRSNSPAYRAESEEYSALVYKVMTEDNVSLYRLAKKLGITHSALQFRLIRYGYKPVSSTARSKVYKPIKQTNRIVK